MKSLTFFVSYCDTQSAETHLHNIICVRKGKRSLLASHTRCKCSMETTHNSVEVKLGIKVMKLVESLIGREVTVGQGSECHLTFVRGLLHIAQ